MNNIIYIELNNWFSGRDYPINSNLTRFVELHKFSDNEWCKENKLCVLCGNIDMSVNWCISAPQDWVINNCPEILTDEKYKYKVLMYYKEQEIVEEKEKAYSDFVKHEDEYGDVTGKFGWKFLKYTPNNFGVTYTDEEE